MDANESNSGFRYTSYALPSTTHIRLLRIQPSDATPHFSSPLVCELFNTPISDPGSYKALSYTWGDEKRTRCLEISGSQLSITPSLDVALRHIRSESEVITLWIDQVCINQNDDCEKEAQVLLMSNIYTKAQQVLAWLGPAADKSDELMDLWADIGKQADELGIEDYFSKEKMPMLHSIMDDPSYNAPITKSYHQLVDEARPRFEGMLQAIIDWDKRPWFHRVWVVQEVSLCSDTVFLCGLKIVPVEHVSLAGNILAAAMRKSIRAIPDIDFRKLAIKAQSNRIIPLLSIRRRRQDYSKGLGTGDELFHLLRKLFVDSDTGATENRDRIYGLLGLAMDVNELKIQPQYAEKDPRPCFTAAARAMIQNGRIEILSFSQFPKENDLKGLPTWVPDWRPMLAPSYCRVSENLDGHLLAASGETKARLMPTQDADTLVPQGFFVDIIEQVGDAWNPSQDNSLHLKLLNTIKKFVAKSDAKNEPIYDTPERRAEATWRVPTGDLYWTPETDHVRSTKPRGEKEYEDCVAVLDIMTSWQRSSPEGQMMRLKELESRRVGAGTYRNSMGAMAGKKPYLTRKGYVGMCSRTAAVGDCVVIFSGARIPHVLRPTGQEGQFKYIGEAHCDGVMDGEILRRSQTKDFFIV